MIERKAMYQVAVKRDFVAQHFLFGGDWGSENELHSHHYRVEVCLRDSGLMNTDFFSTLRKLTPL